MEVLLSRSSGRGYTPLAVYWWLMADSMFSLHSTCGIVVLLYFEVGINTLSTISSGKLRRILWNEKTSAVRSRSSSKDRRIIIIRSDERNTVGRTNACCRQRCRLAVFLFLLDGQPSRQNHQRTPSTTTNTLRLNTVRGSS